jgi:hypothetical protein
MNRNIFVLHGEQGRHVWVHETSSWD